MNSSPNIPFPWGENPFPLLLAPMQGLTNRALREVFADWVKPDVVFTEFVRVKPGAHRVVSKTDEMEIRSVHACVPLVVQLIGFDITALTTTAIKAQELGARHLNLNMGCPFGRMNERAAGGGLLRCTERLPELLRALREVSTGTFSVKLRAGFSNEREVFSLLPVFEDCGVDFLILHPRTVEQKYSGRANHDITAEVVSRTRLPVIANGDVWTAGDGLRVKEQTKAAGLMLGRGAIADPLLFLRLRGQAPLQVDHETRRKEISDYLRGLLPGYKELFCGDVQVLNKMKGVFSLVQEEALAPWIKGLQKSRTLSALVSQLDG